MNKTLVVTILVLISSFSYAQELPSIEDYQQQLAQKYLNIYNNSNESAERAGALEIIGVLDGQNNIPLFIEALSADDEGIIQAAISALSPYKKPEIVDPLVNLLDDDRAIVQVRAAIALQNLGSLAVSKIINLLDHSNLETQIYAVTALGWQGNEEAVPDLLKIYDNSDPSLKIRIIDTLGLIGSETGYPLIKEALHDCYWALQASAAEALRYFDTEETKKLLYNILIGEIAPPVRRKALESAIKMERRASFPLIELALSDPDGTIRARAVSAIHNNYPERGKQLVIDFLNYKVVARIIEESNTRCPQSYFRSFYTDEPFTRSTNARMLAVEYLSSLVDKNLQHLFKQLAENDPDAEVRRAARLALLRLKHNM